MFAAGAGVMFEPAACNSPAVIALRGFFDSLEATYSRQKTASDPIDEQRVYVKNDQGWVAYSRIVQLSNNQRYFLQIGHNDQGKYFAKLFNDRRAVIAKLPPSCYDNSMAWYLSADSKVLFHEAFGTALVRTITLP